MAANQPPPASVAPQSAEDLRIPAGRATALLLVILFVAAAMRLGNLALAREGLWIDEGYSAMVAARPSLDAWSADTHPPLYPALLALWRLPYDTDGMLRFLSVLFGVATLPFVFGIGRRLLDDATALWGTLLLSLLPAHAHYSTEVRMYSLMTLLFAAAWWAVLLFHERRSILALIAYTVAATLLCYSHALGALYTGILVVVAALHLRASQAPRSTCLAFAAANVAVGLLFLPWLGILLGKTREVAASFWIPTPSPVAPLAIPVYVFTVAPLAAVFKEHSLVNERGLAVLKIVLAAPAALLLFWVLIARPKARQPSLLAALLLPPVILYAIGLTGRPLLLVRVVVPVAVPLTLILGLVPSIRGRLRPVALALFATVLVEFAVGSLMTGSYSAKEGWREASLHLQKEAGPDDVILIFSGAPGEVLTETGTYLIQRYDPDDRLQGRPLLNPAETLKDPETVDRRRFHEYLARFPKGTTFWIVDRGGLFRPAADGAAEEIESLMFGELFVSKHRKT